MCVFVHVRALFIACFLPSPHLKHFISFYIKSACLTFSYHSALFCGRVHVSARVHECVCVCWFAAGRSCTEKKYLGRPRHPLYHTQRERGGKGRERLRPTPALLPSPFLPPSFSLPYSLSLTPSEGGRELSDCLFRAVDTLKTTAVRPPVSSRFVCLQGILIRPPCF